MALVTARGHSPTQSDRVRSSNRADDAARAIVVSKRQLFAIKDTGELPYVEAGPQTFVFDPKDLEAWLNKKKKTKLPKDEQHG